MAYQFHLRFQRGRAVFILPLNSAINPFLYTNDIIGVVKKAVAACHQKLNRLNITYGL
jgi:hypothetical protein